MFNFWNVFDYSEASEEKENEKQTTATISDTNSIENEDRIAESLLSEFPEYGTNTNSHQYSDEEDDDDEFYNKQTAGSYGKPLGKHTDDESVSGLYPSYFQDDDRDNNISKTSQKNPSSESRNDNKVTKENQKIRPYSPTMSNLWGDDLNVWTNPDEKTVENSSEFENKDHPKNPKQNHSNHEIQSVTENRSKRNIDNGDSKQLWMPDSLCKLCYACETQFTVFRRRHHCRLCGQVFCSNCSAFFVELPPEKDLSASGRISHQRRTMRVCKMCNEQVENNLELQNKNNNLTNMSDGSSDPNVTVSTNISTSPTKNFNMRNHNTSHDTKNNDTDRRNHVNLSDNVTGNINSNQDTTGNSGNLTFVSQDQNLYDESSFQALNLTKQKLQERTEAALKAAAAAAHEKEPNGIGLILFEHERKKHQLQLQKEASITEATNSRQNGIFDNKDIENKNTPGNQGVNRLQRILQKRQLRQQPRGKPDIEATSSQNRYDQTFQHESEKNEGANATYTHASIERRKKFHNFKDSTNNNIDEIIEGRDHAEEKLAKDMNTGSKTNEPPSSGRQLGITVTEHLEKMTHELIKSDAPLLLKEFPDEKWVKWVDILLMLVTRACATVSPDVRAGDSLDIRPYTKVKVVAGGSSSDCVYISGIIFTKNVSHKRMAREILNPKIMLLSGGIEYGNTRTSNRISSLDTLLEQEEKFTEILVAKIVGIKPDILLVGKSVNRQAQELLLNAGVVLIQHVKSAVMKRISRQTGANILSSSDHVMSQFGVNVFGHCRRFRLVTFRDKDAWTQRYADIKKTNINAFGPNDEDIPTLDDLTKGLPNHERQTFLAADLIGEDVIDGTEAIRSGLAKRGITKTIVMLEGCPKELGCSVVLRGASKPTLKQLKRIFMFMVHVARNLRLETSYLKERRVRLPLEYKIPQVCITCSSSLCVDYGNPPGGRRVRPWNGASTGKNKKDETNRSISGKITAFEHQSILITSVWMTEKSQCCPAEVKGICYYSLQDVSLGQFLRDSCFNLSLKCQNTSCKKSVLEHSLSFIHNDGMIKIAVEQMDDPLPPPPKSARKRSNPSRNKKRQDSSNSEEETAIATWTYCQNCNKVVTPLIYISEDTWQLSFGKFVEIYFYNRDAIIDSKEHNCSCQMQTAAVLYFGCGDLAARFTYETIKPYGVYVRRFLPFDIKHHRDDTLNHLEKISNSSSSLFIRFDKHIEKVSRETRQLFGSAVNKPEHLQLILKELNVIGSEVDHAAKTLQEKIAAVTHSYHNAGEKHSSPHCSNAVLFRLPWHSRRYLSLLTSSWNERLSAIGQTLTAMKKLAASSQSKSSGGRGEIAVVGMNVAANAIVGDGYGAGSPDDVVEGLKRLKQLQDVYSQYNIADIDIQSDTFDMGPDRLGFSHRSSSRRSDFDYNDYDDIHDELENEMLDLSNNDFDSDVAYNDPDADVLMSRRRNAAKESQQELSRSGRPRGKLSRNVSGGSSTALGSYEHPLANQQQDSSKNKAVTPGGAVKSALTRLFNRGNKENDPYMVDLGIFSQGRPRLKPGVDGVVIPVYEDQPSTVIAHSLSSLDYVRQFTEFANDVKTNAESKKPHKPPINVQEERKDIEKRMLVRSKAHIKHTFKELDIKGQQVCKFICTTFWATQFHAVRQAFLSVPTPTSEDSSKQDGGIIDIEKSYVQSLASAHSWAASGGKSGASFSLTEDQRFVVKCISKTELQMFLDCAPAYFEYLSKAFFHGLPTVLCKICGVYQIGITNRITGKRTMENVAIMQNIFYGRKISMTFDLKGTMRGRFAKLLNKNKGDKVEKVPQQKKKKHSKKISRMRSRDSSRKNNNDDNSSAESYSTEYDDSSDSVSSSSEDMSDDEDEGESSSDDVEEEKDNEGAGVTLLDGDFLEFTGGAPLPLNDRAKAVFHMSILNDTLFLSIINVIDYSILVGIDEEKMELVVGIIDFMRQYDILKQMERVGKSLPMVVGSEAPTIIQPPLYKERFTNAMERYFMTVPTKWTTI